MDTSLILSGGIIVGSLIVYYVFFSDNIFEFIRNLLPELIGIAFTYQIIEYMISRRKKKEDERRLKNLYQQNRREMVALIMLLQQMVKRYKHVDDVFYSLIEIILKRVSVIYPVLMAGNDLFTEYYYATLYRVIRDIERKMDYIKDFYQSENIVELLKDDVKMIKLSHDELANFLMHCEYEKNPPNYELFQDQPEQ